MTTDLERVEAQDIQERKHLNRLMQVADTLAASSLLRADLRGKPEDVRAIALTLSQYGLPSSIQNVNACFVVNGRVDFMTRLWTGLAMRYGGHSVWVCDADPEKCSCSSPSSATEGRAHLERGDTGRVYTATFSWDDAKTAGLTDSATYKKFPTDMLSWRALSRVVKRYAPEITAGLVDTEPRTVARSQPRPIPERPAVEEDDVVDGELVEQGEDPGPIPPAPPANEPERGRDNGGADDRGAPAAPVPSGPVDWRARAKAAGMTDGQVLIKLRELAAELGQPLPGTLAEVDEQTSDYFVNWLGD